MLSLMACATLAHTRGSLCRLLQKVIHAVATAALSFIEATDRVKLWTLATQALQFPQGDSWQVPYCRNRRSQHQAGEKVIGEASCA